MQVQKMSDKELINAYLEGNDRCFETLLNRHKEKIYTSIFLFVKDHSQAEDIFQDVFIKIIRTLRRGKYNHEGKFLQWAMRIAYNMCVDHFRKSKRKPTVSPTEEFDIFEVLKVTEDNAETKMIKNQRYDKVRKLIDALPEEQREVVILRHYADLSFKEIAKLTDVSINTALGRMRYALINIRKMIDEKNIAFF
jgi:RNA polymerase sigma-70 factor (ECF subfamily)